MAKPKRLSEILERMESKAIRQLINTRYYGKDTMPIAEADRKFNSLSDREKSKMMKMILADWEKRHPFPDNPSKQKQWQNCRDIIWYTYAEDILGGEFC